MFYYRYEITDNNLYKLNGEKSTTELTGDKVIFSEENIDLQLFDVTVGFIGTNGEMLRHTKKLRSQEVVSLRLNEMKERQIESELDIDFRLSMIELGLV